MVVPARRCRSHCFGGDTSAPVARVFSRSENHAATLRSPSVSGGIAARMRVLRSAIALASIWSERTQLVLLDRLDYLPAEGVQVDAGFSEQFVGL